jgi:hypothetical protein
MFEVLTDLNVTEMKDADRSWSDRASATVEPLAVVDAPPSFRTLNVLLIETGWSVDTVALIEPCLRYSSQFECVITSAGSLNAARFALASGAFDVVVTDDENALGLIAKACNTPVILVEDIAGGELGRRAHLTGAFSCLAAENISPKLLEYKIALVLDCTTTQH